MKVYIYPADETGCGYYRLIWPARILQAEGHDVNIILPSDKAQQFTASMVGDRMVNIDVPADADVIVLQRVTHRHLLQGIELIQKKGIAVVIDMDDDLTCIDPGNPAWELLHPRSSGDHSWQNATNACNMATYVTVSTPALMNVYAPHGRGQVLPNYVPRFFTQITHEDSAIIGWAGAVHSHPNDLSTVASLINRLARAGHKFKIVGPDKRVEEALGHHTRNLIEVTGGAVFHHWPYAVNELGIGIAPLAHTRFNAAKSWLKPLEYAALGIPSVSDARVEYTRLRREHGIGNVMHNANDWRRTTLSLLTNDERRREEGARDRAHVDEHLTIEDNAWRWAEAWGTAAQLRLSVATG